MTRSRQLRLFGNEDGEERPDGRIPLDFYPTDRALTAALLDRQFVNGTVAEPCAGNGDIVSVLETVPEVARVITNDIDPEREADFHGDAGDPAAAIYTAGPFDWVITNPPFSEAHKILPLALQFCRVGVAFLLRLNYLEPATKRNARGEWLDRNADRQTGLFVFGSPRPSFPPYKTNDSVTTAWFVWLRSWSWSARGISSPFQYIMDWKIYP